MAYIKPIYQPEHKTRQDQMSDQIQSLFGNCEALLKRIEALEFRDHQNQIVLAKLESASDHALESRVLEVETRMRRMESEISTGRQSRP